MNSKFLLTAAFALVLGQGAFAQLESEPPRDLKTVASILVGLVTSPEVYKAEGVKSQRQPTAQEREAVAQIDRKFGLGIYYNLPDGFSIRHLRGKNSGVEIRWPGKAMAPQGAYTIMLGGSPDLAQAEVETEPIVLPNVLTVMTDGELLYCCLDGEVSHRLDAKEAHASKFAQELYGLFPWLKKNLTPLAKPLPIATK